MDSKSWEVVTAHEDDEDEEELDWWDDPNDWSSARDRGEWIDDDDEIDSVMEEFAVLTMDLRWLRCPVCGKVVFSLSADVDPPPYCIQDMVAIRALEHPDELPF